MGNPYPYQTTDASGSPVRQAGLLSFTDPANQPGGSSFAPVAYMNLTGPGKVYTNVAGSGYLEALTFDTINGQLGSAITWDAGTPEVVHLVPGWYSLWANDGWNALADETTDAASIWTLAFSGTFGTGGFNATNTFAQTQYQKGGVWMTLSQPLILFTLTVDLTVLSQTKHVSSAPEDYSPELGIVCLATV